MMKLIPRGGTNDATKPALLYLANLRESGRRTMTTALENIARILAGTHWRLCPWHEVRYDHVAALRAVLQAQYAPASVNKHLTALRGVLKSCWQAGLMPGERYRRSVAVPNVKGSTLPRGRMVPADELQALWAAADEKGVRYGALLSVLFRGGLRRDEAASLRWHDVSFETDPTGAETCWLRVDGKGGKERRVPLRNGACTRMRLAQAAGEGLGTRVLGVKDPRSIHKMLTRLVGWAGIPPCSPHDLRRSFVSHALEAGAELAAVSRMAGHADPRTTARYDRRPDDALVEVADALVDP